MADLDGGNWLQRFLEGGVVPQVVAGPAGKAISRLIGAGADIPAAWLEGHAQGIRDKTEAQTQVSRAVAEQAAGMAVDDPAVMERAVHAMLGRAYRAQENREGVAKAAVEELAADPPPNDTAGPSDNFMMKFERLAEEACSEDLRQIFAKLLAGEIREPGAIAPATLHFMSLLEQKTAELVSRVLPHTIDEGVTYIECVNPELSVVDIAYLDQAGFWTPEKSQKLQVGANGIAMARARGHKAFALQADPNSTINLRVAILSRAGVDLLKVLGTDFDFQSMADLSFEKGASAFYYGDLQIEQGSGRLVNSIELTKISKTS